MRFWLDMGVDGLRLDAIPYLVERDGTSCENLAETHVVIKKIREAIDVGYSNRLVLAEANMWPADVRPYFGDGDECHMAFHFPLFMPSHLYGASAGRPSPHNGDHGADTGYSGELSVGPVPSKP